MDSTERSHRRLDRPPIEQGTRATALRAAKIQLSKAAIQIEAGASSDLAALRHRNRPGGSKSAVPLGRPSVALRNRISQERATRTSFRQDSPVPLNQTYPTNEIEASVPKVIDSDRSDWRGLFVVVSTRSMQSIVLHKRLDLRIEEQAAPLPGSGEVLVRVERGGICGSDLHYYHRGGFPALIFTLGLRGSEGSTASAAASARFRSRSR